MPVPRGCAETPGPKSCPPSNRDDPLALPRGRWFLPTLPAGAGATVGTLPGNGLEIQHGAEGWCSAPRPSPAPTSMRAASVGQWEATRLRRAFSSGSASSLHRTPIHGVDACKLKVWIWALL